MLKFMSVQKEALVLGHILLLLLKQVSGSAGGDGVGAFASVNVVGDGSYDGGGIDVGCIDGFVGSDGCGVILLVLVVMVLLMDMVLLLCNAVGIDVVALVVFVVMLSILLKMVIVVMVLLLVLLMVLLLPIVILMVMGIIVLLSVVMLLVLLMVLVIMKVRKLKGKKQLFKLSKKQYT